MKKNNCIFLDRDGTLNQALIKNKTKNFKLRPPYHKKELKIFKDIFALNLFKKKYIFIVISNQPDIKSGLQSISFHSYINSEIKKKLIIKDFFFCKCHPDLEKNCKCYKPSPIMVHKAVKRYNISLENSYFIGDTWRDIKLANKLSMKSILIDRGFKKNLMHEFSFYKSKPNFVIRNFYQLRYIIDNQI